MKAGTQFQRGSDAALKFVSPGYAVNVVPFDKRNSPLTTSVNGLQSSGAEGSRTLDLCIANAALSQLSYRPFSRKTTILDFGFASV